MELIKKQEIKKNNLQNNFSDKLKLGFGAGGWEIHIKLPVNYLSKGVYFLGFFYVS